MAKMPEERTNRICKNCGKAIEQRDQSWRHTDTTSLHCHIFAVAELAPKAEPTPPAPIAAPIYDEVEESIVQPIAAQTGKCGSIFKLKDGYVCSEPKGHYPATEHECECPNPAFTQRWTDEHAEKAEQVDAARLVPGNAPTRKTNALEWFHRHCGAFHRNNFCNVKSSQGSNSGERFTDFEIIDMLREYATFVTSSENESDGVSQLPSKPSEPDSQP